MWTDCGEALKWHLRLNWTQSIDLKFLTSHLFYLGECSIACTLLSPPLTSPSCLQATWKLVRANHYLTNFLLMTGSPISVVLPWGFWHVTQCICHLSASTSGEHILAAPLRETQYISCSQVYRYSNKHLDFYIWTVTRGMILKVVLFFVCVCVFEKSGVWHLVPPRTSDALVVPKVRSETQSILSCCSPAYMLSFFRIALNCNREFCVTFSGCHVSGNGWSTRLDYLSVKRIWVFF